MLFLKQEAEPILKKIMRRAPWYFSKLFHFCNPHYSFRTTSSRQNLFSAWPFEFICVNRGTNDRY